MKLDISTQIIGTHLKDCYLELQQIGALRSWAPYCLDLPSLKSVGARFNNHWGDLITPDTIEYMITVTDEDGLITHSEIQALMKMQSGEFKMRPGSGYPSLGAVYFGCVSPEINEWMGDQNESVDYFYLAYEADASYSLHHSQPFDVTSNVNLSGWPTCTEVLASESPRILLGNPSIAPSTGNISLRRSGRRLQQFQTTLEPFQVTAFHLNMVPDGWYTIHCPVGKAYSTLVRSYRDTVLARHM